MTTKALQTKLSFSKTINILTGTPGYPSAILGRSGFVTYITKITLSITTHVAGDVYLFDDDGNSANPVASHPDTNATAGVPSTVVWNFGTLGTPLTPGANLDISHTSTGVAKAIIEGYYFPWTAPSLDYATRVISDGAVAYWKLDEPSGNFIDEIAGYVGTPTGTVTRNVLGPLSDGTKGVSFDGSTGFIEVPDNAAWHAGSTKDISVECWFKNTHISGAGEGDYLVDCKAAGTNQAGFSASVQTITGGMSFKVANGTTQASPITTTNYQDGVWHHYVGTFKRGTPDLISVYVDGVFRASTSPAANGWNIDPAQPLDFGRYNGLAGAANPGHYYGALDEVAIYMKALTLSQIKEHYRARSMVWVAPTTYSAQVIADGAVAYWRLDEPSGNFIDKIAARVATAVGGITYGQPGFTSDGNLAALFNGSTGYASAGDIAALKPTAAVSVEAFVNPATSANVLNFITGPGTGAITGGYYLLRRQSTGKAEFSIANGAAALVAVSTTTIAVGTIYHIVGTFDGVNIRIYVNGVLEATTAIAGPISYNALPVTIGAGGDADLTRVWAGVIDEVSIYPVVLTPTQIKEHYKARL